MPRTLTARSAARFSTYLLGAVVLVAVLSCAWLGVRGYMAYGHLEGARSSIAQIAATPTDAEVVADQTQSARDDARAARDLTGDPLWRLAEGVPWVGPQLTAARTLAEAADVIAASVLAPLADLATEFSPESLRLVNGAVDLAPFASLQASAAEARDAVKSASAQLSSIDIEPLVRPVRDGVEIARAQVAQASAALDAANRAATLLPTMLGGSAPRTWLLMFQNPAELRSLGGMPGATAIVRTDSGRIELVSQGDASIPRFDSPVLPLDPQVQTVFSDRPAVWFSGTTIVPDFTIGAPLAREMWLREHGVETDGVISLDPIALSYLLDATGPITLPNGVVLSSDDTVSYLLNQVYIDYPDSSEQNAVFASAAAAVFEALSGGRADPVALIAALARAGNERRLLLWSNDAAEQEVIAGSTLSGHLPASDSEVARFGVYLNDGTGSKLGYYLDVDTELSWDSCDSTTDQARQATLTVTMTNTAPIDAATSLPPSIAGGNYGVPAGVLRVIGYVYLPLGSTLLDATVTLAPGFGGGNHGGYRVMSFPADIGPGQTSVVTITVEIPGPVPDRLMADITPAFGETSVAATCG